MNNEQDLFKKLGFTPNNIELFDAALTHASYKNEHIEEDIEDYDRLEFVGDSVLDLVVAQLLYEAFPKERSGTLTKMRAYFVNGKTLSEISKDLNLLEYARLSNGEIHNNLDRQKLLEDMFEAFIGAIYLDQGFDKVKQFISDLFLEQINSLDIESFSLSSDPKSSLQEILQSEGADKIYYRVVEESGNAQNKVFVIEVVCNDVVLGVGKGCSKKIAEKLAAADALQRRIK